MEVELVTEGVSEEDTFGVDDHIDDYSSFEGERCGICMDIIIDRGVLDCCQHWFCFACIDNWATITNLCPLCQNEFQLITCVPVYDTIGSNKAEEDSYSSNDDWCIGGKNNTLSFPSYYIDENAVICLDGNGCKIRSGSATVEEDSNLDTSIACDSCDVWYHAFCVGFDPEGTCENSWLCPRCVVNEMPQKSDGLPVLGLNNQCGSENVGNECLLEVAFSGKVSVSVADAGETAVVVSMVEGNQGIEETSGKFSTFEDDKDVKFETLLSSSDANTPKLEASSSKRIYADTNLEAHGLELSLSRETSFSLPSNSFASDDKITSEPSGIVGIGVSSRKLHGKPYNDEPVESGLDLHLGLSMGSSLSVEERDKDVAEDQTADDMQQKNSLEESLLPDDNVIPDKKENIAGITGAKRKHTDCRSPEDGETNAKMEAKGSAKKVKAEGNGQLIHLKDEADKSFSDETQKFPCIVAAAKDDRLRCVSEEEKVSCDIRDVVQGIDHRAFKRLALSNLADESSKERQNAAGLRVKKIMRRGAGDKDSSVLVQELRKEIREAVRNKTSKESEGKLFDPELLAAFRAAVAGPVAEIKTSPSMVVKAKKSLLQKGKIRENLTKKIYGIGGRRKRAWTRDCEIEFWKHRCLKTTKPEKIETLKSVLDVLRKSSESTQVKQGNEGNSANSILSRLYLADTSVFPRKDDIKPLSALKATGIPEQNKEHNSKEKAFTASLGNHSAKTPQKSEVSSEVSVPSIDSKGTQNTVPTTKGEAASGKVHPNKSAVGVSISTSGGSKLNCQKEMVCKSGSIKNDKRKWALEVLARKTAVTGRNAAQESQENSAMLKGNYPLLAQLPTDMRPILASSRHNKIPLSIRQAQLYRLTEHFLKKANLPIICRTADTELAVADAVNIEREVADRSNSKLVYLNLCSQELLHRSDNIKSGKASELYDSPTSPVPADGSEEAANDPSSDPMVDEALRKAGLLPDSPPNSPQCQTEKIKEEVESFKRFKEEVPDNFFEMDSHPDLDIYGDFEYDLEDEDFIGSSALNISKLQPEGESKMKVVFSTLNSDRSNGALDFEAPGGPAIVEIPKGSSGLLQCHDDKCIGSSTVDNGTDKSPTQNSLLDEGGEEPSLAECEELYGPDKEPLIEKFPGRASIKPYELIANNITPVRTEDHQSNCAVKISEQESESYVENLVVATAFQHISGIESSRGHSQTGQHESRKEKISKIQTNKQSDSCSPVSKKVEAYIKEHIRPLCKSGVITVEQYRWAVGKTADKVMKHHFNDKNANFLVKEGEKVKKLAEQYVEAAQKMGKNC